MARLMDFTTETPDCCEIGDILHVEENKLPTSYWYMIEHAYGASGNFKNRERLKTREGKVVKKWSDDRFKSCCWLFVLTSAYNSGRCLLSLPVI